MRRPAATAVSYAHADKNEFRAALLAITPSALSLDLMLTLQPVFVELSCAFFSTLAFISRASSCSTCDRGKNTHDVKCANERDLYFFMCFFGRFHNLLGKGLCAVYGQQI